MAELRRRGHQPLRRSPSLELSLADVHHDVVLSEFDTLPASLNAIVDCAGDLLETLGLLGTSDVRADGIRCHDSVVRVGPLQASVLTQLRDCRGYHPSVTSAYRSLSFQSLLFSSRFLCGDMHDRHGRLTVALPGDSDHQRVDGAIDVVDHNAFLRALLGLDRSLPVSFTRPYLADPGYSCEPWHWRLCLPPQTAPAAWEEREPGSAVPTRPNHTRADEQALAIVAAALRGESPELDILQRDHVFVSGLAQAGGEKCVGSVKETLSASIRDACAAVGLGWDARYLTIPSGYSPVFDNRVLAVDVGRCTFAAVSDSGATTCMTGASCCHHRVIDARQVEEDLQHKAGLSFSAGVALHRSTSVDYLVLADDILIPAEYGLPAPRTERRAEGAALLVGDYHRWLTNACVDGFPIYSSQDYARTYSTHLDRPRLAMLLLYLVRHGDVLSPDLARLAERLWSLLCSPTTTKRLCAGDVLADDDVPEATILFLVHALWLSGDRQQALRLWRAQLPLILDATSKATQSLDIGNSIIYLGHLCHLLGVLEEAAIEPRPDLMQMAPSLHVAAAEAVTVPQYSCGGSQILAYLARVRGSSDALSLAHDALVSILRWPSSGNPAERGAFCGAESFHSILPLEGSLFLADALALSNEERLGLRERLHDGVAFARRLQFLPGSGALTRNPHLLEGAVRFSLMDHQFRFDYGMHASHVALSLDRATLNAATLDDNSEAPCA
ncbi:D-alanyl-D-alanine carboxypeptidase family protein [Streptomyces virginiae]|uniref:hypothetical protein n=1 Tax=Streptomyces TaxID=1883 RepID=UPI00324BB00D